MHIGLRTLGGDPDAFYSLDVERQVDVMAALRLEAELRAQANPRRRGRAAPPVNYASEDARTYWAHAFGG